MRRAWPVVLLSLIVPVTLYIAEVLGIRPEDIRLGGPGNVTARVVVAELAGAEKYVYLDIAGTQVIVRTDADQPVQAGETIDLQFRPDRLHLFDGRDDTARAVRLT